MNMALRPSSLLLLLLVMIPAAEQKNYQPLQDNKFEPDLDCKKPAFFCFLLTDRGEKTMARTVDPNNAGNWAINDGGIALHAASDIRWVITIDYTFDAEINKVYVAEFSVITPAGKFTITAYDIVQAEDRTFRGIEMQPLRYSHHHSLLEFELHVNTGSYIADEFQIFADPEIQLEINKEYYGHDGYTLATTAKFEPFLCWIASDGVKPDASAVKATQTKTTFSCTSGKIFLEGTNTHADKVYCGGGGWFGLDRQMILKRTYPEKQHPYCMKDPMFEDCTTNKCFVFGDALVVPQPADKLVKVDDSTQIKDKLGAYLVFESDTVWQLHIAYNNRDADLTSITIGAFDFKKFETVVMKKQRKGPKLLSGLDGFLVTLEAKPNEADKDLMNLFGFYKGVENKMKIEIGGKKFDAEGVANFGKYERTTSVTFGGINGFLQKTPNVHNLFSCNDGKTIYLDNERTGFNEIRFTKKKGWLKKDGTPVSAIKDSSGTETIAAVYCFSVCQEATLTFSTDLKDPKPIKDQAKMEYTCNGDVMKVNSKLYASISCENDQWKGDQGDLIAAPAPKFTIGAECYGGFKFVKTCMKSELDEGCGEVKIAAGVLTCDDGFLLTLLGQDDDKIRTSLRVNKDDHWFDGTDDIGKTAANDRPLCYAKCAPRRVILTPETATEAVEAKYAYAPNTQEGILKCHEPTHVLVVTLDGKKTPFVKDVMCDKDGWRIQGKTEKAAEHQSGKIHAECHKVCMDKLNMNDCPDGWTKPDDCGQVNPFGTTVQCSLATEILFVNDNPIDKPIVCSKEGWAKKGDPTNLIIDHLKQFKDRVKVECFSKCGKKFVTGDAIRTKTTAGYTLSCAESKMIGYKLNNEDEVDTLEKLECDKDSGWKDSASTQIFTFAQGLAATVEANCKTSCIQQLITKKCDIRSPGCAEAKLSGEELTCDPGKWLYAQNKVETGTIQCKTKSFESKSPSTAIKIDRASPTSTAEISCLSKCDKTIMVTAGATDAAAKIDEEAGKLTETEAAGKLDIACTDELHYAEITHNNDPRTTKHSQKWTCDPMTGWTSAEDPAKPIADWINGENIKKTCRNKCKGRFKPCSGCEVGNIPLDADNKLKCANTHVLRTNETNNVLEFENEELVCKKDGFYSKDELVLKFDDMPSEDVATLFDVKCVSKCAFVRDLSQEMKDKLNNEKKLSDPTNFYKITPLNSNKKLQCKNDEILFIHSAENPATGRRVFGETECKESIGWTGKEPTKDANGVWTTPTTDETIVNFASQSAKIVASCMKVCAAEMLSDTCTANTHLICSKKNYASSTLECPDNNHRLFLNGKKSQDSSATNKLQCSKEGWKDGNEMVIDFRETPDEIPTLAEVYCKHKCHEDFIEYSEGSCPDGKTCSKAKYEGGKLSCAAGTTEILVIEHDGKRRESFATATCSDAGWSKDVDPITGTGVQLFALAEKNFHIKARCEDICAPAPHVDIRSDNQETSRSFDAAKKLLTCTKESEMLALEGTGVYADMICSKKGWSTIKWTKGTDGTLTSGPDELKIKFEPMTDDTKVTDQEAERAKKFTCVENDCLRAFKCQGHDFSKIDTQEDCINPNITKIKYQMSCESPSKVTKGEQSLAYDSLLCIDGVWKSSSGEELVGKLQEGDISKPVPERNPFEVFCNSEACTGCKAGDLANIASTTDANIVPGQFNEGTFKTCSNFKCGTGAHFVIEDQQTKKRKYYVSDSGNSIKCSSQKEASQKTFSAPDGKSMVGGPVGCVRQIPCNEHRPINTNCGDKKECNTTETEKFNQILKDASRRLNNGQPELAKCDILGQMYYEKDENKWAEVNELQCNEKGEWDIKLGDATKFTLPETTGAGTRPRIICSKLNPNPDAPKKGDDPKTDTCKFCPFPTVLNCDGCTKPADHASTTNTGNWICKMTIVNGRFKFNGDQEIKKDDALVCQNYNGEHYWRTPDGKRVDTLAVIMKDSDNISTGAIAGIVIGVILVLGLIVFAMVYMAIRKRKEIERQEKLKSKGLEQKQDSIIDAATIVDDTKTLVI